jgi:hypothetical protein
VPFWQTFPVAQTNGLPGNPQLPQFSLSTAVLTQATPQQIEVASPALPQ